MVWRLAPVTQLIAAVDERAGRGGTTDAKEAEVLIQEAGSLLVATSEGKGFRGIMTRHLRSPDVILAHATAARVIRAKGPLLRRNDAV